jgi:hypothetical protein
MGKQAVFVFIVIFYAGIGLLLVGRFLISVIHYFNHTGEDEL